MRTMEEVIESLNRRNAVIEEARAGKEPVCPKCKSGHIKCQGEMYFYCNNPNCNMSITIEPKRD